MSYDEAFASVYDAFTGNIDYCAEAEFVMTVMNNAGVSGNTVLDVACGTGTLAEMLLERGNEVICVDISQDMLNKARDKLCQYGDRVLLLCQDMCELDLFGTVDCAVCMLDSVNHLNGIDEVKKAFERIFLFLEPGGVFIFDVNTIYKHREILGNNTFVYESADSFFVWQNELRPDGKTVDMYIDIFSRCKNGTYTRESDDITETAYDIDTIRTLLENIGFEKTEVYSEDGEKTIRPDEQRLRFTAVKPMSYKEKMQNG